MSKKGKVYFNKSLAGFIEETEEGYRFYYTEPYLRRDESQPVSKTLPLRQDPYESKTMFPFFDGLIPEGWLLNIATAHWKIDQRDRMSLLLATCKDTIGAVSIVPVLNVES